MNKVKKGQALARKRAQLALKKRQKRFLRARKAMKLPYEPVHVSQKQIRAAIAELA